MDKSELVAKYGRCVVTEPKLATSGKLKGKRVVTLLCKCGAKTPTATSDVFQRCCPKCGEKIAKQKKGGRS